jgi:5-hydroxyisourate hydrolase-like protein (transthyretin family)
VRRADLTGGVDGTVEFAPQPFMISGKVTAGDAPKAASVVFRRGNGDTSKAHADSSGAYEVTLWMSDMYIIETILEEDPSQPPFSRATRLWSTRTIDIHVPMTKVKVEVTDAATGKPVAGAEVTTFNRWDDPASGKGSASHTVMTDAQGIARLAPLSQGTAEIHVKADGYFKDEPAIIAVTDDSGERTVAVKLRPAGATSVVRVILPNGAPAEGAEVMLVGDPGGSSILWSGRADTAGRVSVPRSLAQSILLVRHPAAAGLARRFQDLPDQEYRLIPASPQPLLVRVERRGEPPAGFVGITVWFGGLPLTGGALEFLVRTPAFVPSGGIWKAMSLPREPVRILASSGTIDAQIAAGAYDALATVVPEPRPAQIVLNVVD